MERSSKAFPIVISGPSGVGKTTLVDRLLDTDRSLRESVSVTTRSPREGEVHGAHYYFIARAEFEKMKNGELVEWAEVHGEFYGTPRPFIERELAAGHDVVLNIDIQGGINVKKAFPESVMVFILPPSFEALEERIRGRGGDEEIHIERRLAAAKNEINASGSYDYVIVNDDLAGAVSQLQAVVTAERCRQFRALARTRP